MGYGYDARIGLRKSVTAKPYPLTVTETDFVTLTVTIL